MTPLGTGTAGAVDSAPGVGVASLPAGGGGGGRTGVRLRAGAGVPADDVWARAGAPLDGSGIALEVTSSTLRRMGPRTTSSAPPITAPVLICPLMDS